jgi:hypothetical protein
MKLLPGPRNTREVRRLKKSMLLGSARCSFRGRMPLYELGLICLDNASDMKR